MKKLPAGLIDNSLEIFRHSTGIRAVMNGSVSRYIELPTVLREPFQVELINDKKACSCLRNDFGIHDADMMEEQFVSCRYGALDHSPDWDGEKLRSDAPVCDKIADCKGFNIVCRVPEGKNGTLSRSEYLVAQLVGEGKLDKEIASTLDIEITTVRTHLSRIRDKLCVNNRVEIAFWASTKGII
ncbi:response regulator transcription factor [Labilibacter sediminis]|nr:response regulator transcription factor [Labilibacter sediminis]